MLVVFVTGYVLVYMLEIVERMICVFVLPSAFGVLEMIELGMIF